MHPINSKNFGRNTGKIAIKFFDGSSVVTGSVVKQLGSSTFAVHRGLVNRTVRLAQTNADLTTLNNSTNLAVNIFGTIEVTPYGGSVENVKKITSALLYTIQGSKCAYKVNVAATVVGQGTISTYTNVAPVLATPSAKTITTTAVTALGFTAGTDPNGDLLTYSLVGTLPAKGSLTAASVQVTSLPYTVTAANLASISFAVANNTANGSYTVTLQTSDSISTTTAVSAITVTLP